ncbi:UDP-N-acetylmuramate dehydrogenase [Shewanella sp. AS1]|nr:UDP-N-acetylmuramate dehydrogenase [Shewanella sp. AS1]MCE9680205.1 UDP-N-acetylmuramate dehydrogenase [Shewanella sp. AS1]
MIIKHSLLQFNTLGLNVYCDQLIQVGDDETLIHACLEAFKSKQPLLLIGGGSNLVLTADFVGRAVVIETKGIEVTHDESHYLLSVAAGENWHGLVEYCLKHNMHGLENLALIPGCVGAAPIQNIGAYGAELAQFCEWVEYLDLESGEIKTLNNDECAFGYRESIFKGELKDKAVILRVGLRLAKAWQPNLTYGPLQQLSEDNTSKDNKEVTPQAVFDCICATRAEKLPDPQILGNVGSFFKNPVISEKAFKGLQATYEDIVGYRLADSQVKLAAAWLIDKAGLKGTHVGAASVHLKQALVIVNNGGCSGDDVCRLARLVIDKVYRQFGVSLEVEPRIIGADAQKDIQDA